MIKFTKRHNFIEAYEALLLRTLYEQTGSITGCIERSGFVRNTLSVKLRKYAIIPGK